MELKNKVVLLTGAASGIGKALAFELHRAGAKLAICDVRSDMLNDVTQHLTEDHFYSSVVDVADESATNKFIDESIAKFGHIDVLINNAGVALGKFYLEEVKRTDLDWLMDINLKAPLLITQKLLPQLKSRPQAYIVVLSSVFGLAGIKEQVPYCVSKFAVRGLGEALRMELINTNVKILNVHPAGVKTNIVNFSRMKAKDQIKMPKIFNEKLAKTDAQTAANQIVKAISQNKGRLLIGSDARLIDALARFFPASYSKIFYKFFKQ